eukprot:c22042_g3_i1.p2 GENE.c22042_g3_i1~~c22042_g3_i1.p2  ORF type:complete len:304 (-),score=157.48 c22042_g3_i1:1249-2121(-)
MFQQRTIILIFLFFVSWIQCSPTGRGTRRDGILVAQIEPLKFQSEESISRQKLCPNECSGHGVCNVISTEGFPPSCSCLYLWSGTDCSTASCPNDCSLSGFCDDTTGLCLCNPGLTGADCSKKSEVTFTCENDCNQNGICDHQQGKCECFTGWLGNACETQLCKNNCSNHGLCWDMNGSGAYGCTCDKGWVGDYCQTIKIECEDNCSGHGVCDYSTGVCQCNKGWKIPNCLIKDCTGGYLSLNSPHPPPEGGCPNDCSCQGYCTCVDNNNCFCECQPGWAGDDCSVGISQ